MSEVPRSNGCEWWRTLARAIVWPGLAALLAIFAGCKPAGESSKTTGEARVAVETNKQVALINEKLEAIRQAGYPVTLEELDRWIPTPPESENAALLWTNAFADFWPANVPTLPARGPRLSLSAKQSFQGILRTNKVMLERLHAASTSTLTQSRFPLNWTAGMDMPLRHLSKMKAAARVLQFEAVLYAEDKRLDQAVATVATMISLAKSLDQEPIVISQLIRLAILSYACKTTERTVSQNRLTDVQLTKLQEMFQTIQTQETLTRALVGERCFCLSAIQRPRKDMVELLEYEFFTGQSRGFVVSSNEIPLLADSFVKQKNADRLFLLDAMEGLIAASKLPYPQSVDSMRAIADRGQELWQQPPGKRLVVSTTSLGYFTNVVTKFAQSTAFLRTTETALAVERYRLAHSGQIPQDLSALTPLYLDAVPADPFDGQPLRFKRLSKGYVIYSVGSDGRDDGGKENTSVTNGVADSDETFTVER